jgi:hypothetical protein
MIFFAQCKILFVLHLVQRGILKLFNNAVTNHIALLRKVIPVHPPLNTYMQYLHWNLPADRLYIICRVDSLRLSVRHFSLKRFLSTLRRKSITENNIIMMKSTENTVYMKAEKQKICQFIRC